MHVTPDTRADVDGPQPGPRGGRPGPDRRTRRICKPGLPHRDLRRPTAQSLARTQVDFISPRVDDADAVGARQGPARRTTVGCDASQYVRARIVWRTGDGLTVPVLACCASTASRSCSWPRDQDGRLVAQQRPIRVGPIVGNDITVLDGLTAGRAHRRVGRAEARRRRADPRPRRPRAEPGLARGPPAMFVDTFIRRPILASVVLAGHRPRRRDRASRRCRSRSSRSWRRRRSSSSRSTTAPAPQTVETAVTTPLEQAINGVEGMQYMTSTSGNDGTCSDHGHLRRHPRSRPRRRRRAEPRHRRPRAGCRTR